MAGFRAVYVRCGTCRWRGQRVPRDDDRPYGACPKCGGWLARSDVPADRRYAKARAELAGPIHASSTRRTTI